MENTDRNKLRLNLENIDIWYEPRYLKCWEPGAMWIFIASSKEYWDSFLSWEGEKNIFFKRDPADKLLVHQHYNSRIINIVCLLKEIQWSSWDPVKSEIQVGPGILSRTILGFSGRLTASFLSVEEIVE